MEERLSARLDRMEGGVGSAAAVPAAAAAALPAPPTSTDLAQPAQAPLQVSGPDPEVLARNQTISALVGVSPVGSRQPDPTRLYEFDISDSPSKGPSDAPITIVEFSDFQCNFCKKAQVTLARVQEVYGDRLRWVWKHLPLSMHEDAPRAHLASVAAANQGKFWEYHDRLFANQSRLKLDDLREHAFDVGLGMQQFELDLEAQQTRAVVEADMTEAVAIALTATPGFFINGRYLRGNQPFEKFAELIDAELARLGESTPAEARAQ